MSKTLYYVGGISVSGHKRYLCLLFGEDNFVKYKVDNKTRDFIFYFLTGTFDSETRLEMKSVIEEDFTSLIIREIDF